MLAGLALPAGAQQSRITNLANASYGTVSLTTDSYTADNVCAYSSTSTHNYTVVANGDGAGGAFLLTAGAATLPYEVEWAGTVSQTSGNPLTPGTPSGIYTSTRISDVCAQQANATLITRLRAVRTSVAQAGTYTGTLFITITPQ